jgi:TonB family protein
MRAHPILLMLLLIPLAPAAAAPTRHELMADVVVSAEGRVTEFSVGEEYKGMEAVLREVVSKWTFLPATVDDKPVDIHTTLVMTLHADPGAGGEGQARLEYRGNGSGVERMVTPRYPSLAFQDGAAGIVLLAVSHDATGRVTEVTVRESRASRPQYRKAFDIASTYAVRSWVFKPERINGVALPGKALIPVVFTVDSGDQVPRLPPSPESEALAAGPAVLLRSEVPLVLQGAAR